LIHTFEKKFAQFAFNYFSIDISLIWRHW